MEAALGKLRDLLSSGSMTQIEFDTYKGQIESAYSFARKDVSDFSKDSSLLENLILSTGSDPLPAPEALKVSLWTLANLLEDVPVGHGLRETILSDEKLINTLLQLHTAALNESIDLSVAEHLMRVFYNLSGRGQIAEIRDDKLLQRLVDSPLVQTIAEKYPWNKQAIKEEDRRMAISYALGVVQELCAVHPIAAVAFVNSERALSALESIQAQVLEYLKLAGEESYTSKPQVEQDKELHQFQLALVCLWKFLSIALQMTHTPSGSKAINPNSLARIFKMVSLMTFDPAPEEGEEGEDCCDADGNCCNEGSCEKGCCDDGNADCCDENGNCSNAGSCEKDCCSTEGGKKDSCCGDEGCCDDGDACCDDPSSCNACEPSQKKTKTAAAADHREEEDDCCADEEAADVDQFDINASGFFATMALDSEFVNSPLWVEYKNPQTNRTLPFDLGQLAGKLLSSTPDDRVITNCLVALLSLSKSSNEKVQAEAKEVLELLVDEETGVLDIEDLESVKLHVNMDAISLKISSGYEIPNGEEDKVEGEEEEEQADSSKDAKKGLAEASAVKKAITEGVCTFAHTAKKFSAQYFYECADCSMQPGEGVCVVCAEKCHKGHKLSKKQHSMKFYCDCGGSHAEKCKSLVSK